MVTIYSGKVDFVFLVDGSGSICNNNGLCDNWRTITTFISNIASKLSVGVDGSHVGMITFGSRANLIWDLNTLVFNSLICLTRNNRNII